MEGWRASRGLADEPARGEVMMTMDDDSASDFVLPQERVMKARLHAMGELNARRHAIGY
jgi:hypothetical protein